MSWTPGDRCVVCHSPLCYLDLPESEAEPRTCWVCRLPFADRLTGMDVADLWTQLRGEYARPGQVLTVGWRPLWEAVCWELKRRPCCRCRQAFPPVAMDFHHISKTEKRGEISTLSLVDGIAELVVCIVLCATCHRIEEYARRTAHRGINLPPGADIVRVPLSLPAPRGRTPANAGGLTRD